MPARATIRLSLACNNRCAFCAQDGLSDDAVDFEVALERARAQGDEITFVGGEPTLDPLLVEKISRARAVGFRRIGVQTNGSRLADDAFAASLAQAGLTDVHLSLHGSDAAVHDYHTGRAGSFGELLRAIQAVRASGLPVVVTTVLTRSNFRVLGGIPTLLAARGISAWFVSLPALAGRAAVLRDRIAPRLGLALPFALHAMSAAIALKVPTRIVGAPLCLLGPYAANVLADKERAYAGVCTGCPARAACPGVDPIYLERFGGDELTPRDLPARPLPPDATTAMFVGPGELAPAPALVVPAADRPRTSLPMLGKVKPALAEATPGTERRTGSDLKEIFPTLFENDAKP